jgi:hypothetical protein
MVTRWYAHDQRDTQAIITVVWDIRPHRTGDHGTRHSGPATIELVNLQLLTRAA